MSKPIRAAILDMDGVLTITATVHAQAWKRLFDAFLQNRQEKHEKDVPPFSIEEDYPAYLDGIPRYDGIERFLESRGISLPFGYETDPPGFDSISALGNLKNKYFHEALEENGVETYRENIEAISQWKANGLALAVISSSKNCKEVLERAGILHLFDVRVDGTISGELGLKGKPAADIFLKAAEQLHVDKGEIVVVEDAQMGVEAAKSGGFDWVVGFSQNGGERLRQHGADEVVSSLKHLDVTGIGKDPAALPAALDHIETIIQRLSEREPVFFFDYDGTLTPIVEDYTEAFLDEGMRCRLEMIAKHCLTGVVSGRGLDDVRERIGSIEGFYYVGSHGFEIAGPEDFYDQHEEAARQLPLLDEAQVQLTEAFAGDENIEVERKKFAIAVHYRNAPEDAFPIIKRKVENVLTEHSLKKGTGKKILELKPDVDWHKGRAIEWLMKELKVDKEKYLPVYLGDDITDEDAFEAMEDRGIGILVGKHGRTTHARYCLKDVEEVGLFLDKIIAQLK